MSTREFFVQRWEQELAAFGKVLRAVPENQLADGRMSGRRVPARWPGNWPTSRSSSRSWWTKGRSI